MKLAICIKRAYLYSLPLIISYALIGYERPIVVIIPSYNNESLCLQNLDSVYDQDYTHYRVIYINDHSTDHTYQKVVQHTTARQQEGRTMIINNRERKGSLANLYMTIWSYVEDHEIVVQLDGDDFFAHTNVLSRINQAYTNPNVWLTYGQHVNNPPISNTAKSAYLPSFVVSSNGYREYAWVTSAPRTFYAWLFKQIKLQTLLNESLFFKTAGDTAYMFAMLEMAAGNYCFIPDVLYIYNCATNSNDHTIHAHAQLKAANIVRAQKKYNRYRHPKYDAHQALTISCIIFSDHSPENLEKTVRSITTYGTYLESCTVMYTPSPFSEIQYQTVRRQYPDVTWVESSPASYKNDLVGVLAHCQTSYTLLTSDAYHLTKPVNLRTCTQALAQTQAHAFYLTLGKDAINNSFLARKQHLPPHTALKNGINAWQFYTGEYTWSEAQSLGLTTYKTEYIKQHILECSLDCYTTLEKFWHSVAVDSYAVGLFFDTAVGKTHDASATKRSS